ncbi:MAG TPA: hypothetical protein VGI15_00675, partial [Candidatus Cybelea sp.]
PCSAPSTGRADDLADGAHPTALSIAPTAAHAISLRFISAPFKQQLVIYGAGMKATRTAANPRLGKAPSDTVSFARSN